MHAPFSWAQAVYCTPNQGDDVNGATVLWTAGDGGATPHVYVAYSQSQNKIIVSHEGTDPFNWDSIKNDLKFAPADPNDQLARCVPQGSTMHDGFQQAWSRTADDVLAQVRAARDAHPGASVLVTGHSLGAALAALDSIYLACNGVDNAETIVFGQPRVGNFPFVSSLQRHSHLTNYADPVPHLPPHDDDFYWAGPNEFWQNPADSNSIYDCGSYENTNCAWSIKFDDYDVINHLGVYAGVPIRGSLGC